MSGNFAHTHLHSMYSLLDGCIKFPELLKFVKDNGMNAVACTDHGWAAGLVTFYKECKKAGIKALLGSEAYLTLDPDNLEENKQRDNYHLILIAKDNIGYSLLLQELSNAALHNFYYKPRINVNNLKHLAGHVCVTSACLAGIVSKHLQYELDTYGRVVGVTDPSNSAVYYIEYLSSIFKEDFYLELQVWDDGNHHQKFYNESLLDIGRKKGIPFVITSDAHYLLPEEHQLHEMLMAMQLKMTIEEYRNSGQMQYGPYFYLAKPEEMLERARSIGCEEAFHNTSLLADKCNVELTLGKYEFPVFDITSAPDYQEFLEWKEQNEV